MADDQLAGTGQKAQLHISTDDTTANLFRLKGVKSFDVPGSVRAWLEMTDLDSDAKEYAPDLPDTDEISATLNYRPGSDTDDFLDTAGDDADPRAIRMILPVRGVLAKQYDFLGYISYKPGEASVGDIMESEVTIRPTGAVTRSDYVAP